MSLWAEIGKLINDYRARYKDRYYGSYRAILVDNNDPAKLGRVRIVLPTLWGNKPSDWVPPVFPLGSGGFDFGEFRMPPLVDAEGRRTGIMVQFEGGFKDHPMWTGTWARSATTDNVPDSDVMKLARGEADETTKGEKGGSFMPASPFAAEYPFNWVVKSPGGHVFEMDDTEDAERLHLWHSIGTYQEWGPLGQEDKSIEGDRHFQVKGDELDNIVGSRDEVVGVGKTTTVTSGDYAMQASSGSITFQAGSPAAAAAKATFNLTGGFEFQQALLPTSQVLVDNIGPLSFHTKTAAAFTEIAAFAAALGVPLTDVVEVATLLSANTYKSVSTKTS